ncbi:MAG: four helix bundle protein [Pseudomonadota bacterium]
MGGNERQKIRHFRELDVYRFAFGAAMTIFQITKAFPAEERYALVDQIRRSSRSVCANLAEGWRKRKYEAVFRNKMTDAMQEASETQCWLEFASACTYIAANQFSELDKEYERIIAMLNGMEKQAEKFCYKSLNLPTSQRPNGPTSQRPNAQTP